MSKWKGIVLAGGSGSRLFPVTKSVSKQLLPVYDKPMIYYPISVLMLAEIKEILIITTPHEQHQFMELLGNGSKFGIKLSYEIQPEPNGLAEAFIIGEKFIGNDNVCLILGDNIFYGQGFKSFLTESKNRSKGATIFAYQVTDPERFGVVEFDANKIVKSLEEKPSSPKSNFAVTGLYFYDNDVVDLAKTLKPSPRGELEITSLNQCYLDIDRLYVKDFGRGFAWLDTGTHNSLLEAGQFVQLIQKRQGLKVACLEELGYLNGWINKRSLLNSAEIMINSEYGKYLTSIID